jgi:hypothetical protein
LAVILRRVFTDSRMRHPIIGACLIWFLAMPGLAVAQSPQRPSIPPPPLLQSPPPDCVDARNSPDYVPGVDARGHAVAPADVPGTADVQISTEVYAELRSPNPQLRGAGVSANLAGLATRPLCPPKVRPQNYPKR